MIVDETEFRAEIRRAYECGVTESRAAFSSQLTVLAENFTERLNDVEERVFQYHCDVRRALKLPPPASPDDWDATLQ